MPIEFIELSETNLRGIESLFARWWSGSDWLKQPGSGLGYLPTMCWASLSFSQMLSINSVSGSKSNGTFTVHDFV